MNVYTNMDTWETMNTSGRSKDDSREKQRKLS